MNQHTEFRDQSYHRVQSSVQQETGSKAWRGMRQVAARAVLWSYERGSWQYDIIVLVILGFIFLTPSAWFHDRPQLQLTDLRHVQGVVELSHTKDTWTLEVDARLVQSLKIADAGEAIREILRPRFRESFSVKSVRAIRDKSGVILGYTAVVTSP